MRILPTAAAAIAALTLAGAGHTATYIDDFEGLAHDVPAGAFQAGGLVHDGLKFRNTQNGANSFVVFARNDSRNGDAGGATLATYFGNTTTRVERADQMSFDLTSIDLGDYFNYGQALTVQLSFFDTSGAFSHQLLTLDSLSGLQTLTFNKTNLKAFEYAFLGSWGQIDNIMFADSAVPVPEPGSWALLLAGFGGMGGFMRRSAARNRQQALAN